MTTRQTPDAVREAVARIVDPKAWEDHDYWASRLRGEGDWPTAPDEVAMIRRSYERRMPLRVAESFRRTDAILAALDSRAGDAGEGWKLVPVVPTEDMTRALYEQGCTNAGWAAILSATPAPAVDAGRRAWHLSVYVPEAVAQQGESRIRWYFDHAIRGYAQKVIPLDHDPMRQMSSAIVAIRSAAPAVDAVPAEEEDDLDTSEARLEMVRVPLRRIVDDPTHSVAYAKAGLDLIEKTAAERAAMRGEA